MENVKKNLSSNLKERRSELKLTQPGLAEKAGVSWRVIQCAEAKTRFPGPENLAKIAKAAGCAVSDLLHDGGLPMAIQRPPITPEEALEALKQFVHKESVSSLSRPKQDLFALISPLDDTEVAWQVDRLRAELLAPEHASLEESKQGKKTR